MVERRVAAAAAEHALPTGPAGKRPTDPTGWQRRPPSPVHAGLRCRWRRAYGTDRRRLVSCSRSVVAYGRVFLLSLANRSPPCVYRQHNACASCACVRRVFICVGVRVCARARPLHCLHRFSFSIILFLIFNFSFKNHRRPVFRSDVVSNRCRTRVPRAVFVRFRVNYTHNKF